jgi:hypothetical protein
MKETWMEQRRNSKMLQMGPIRSECPKKPQGGTKCYECGRFRHLAKDCQSKGKTQFKIKVRSMNDKETTTIVKEAKEDFPEGLK